MDKFLTKTKRPREEETTSVTTFNAPTRTSPRSSPRKAPAPAQSLSEPVAALLASLTDASWRTALNKEVGKSYFSELATKVAAEREKKKIFPPAAEVFTAFNLTPLPDVRVVILGQDPYHGPGQAHGLSFSVGHGVQVPPSLKNIYTELESDLEGEFRRPTHGHLAAWARRGVLLLNATLTVRSGEANSHQAFGWQTFTDAVIKVLNARTDPIVFILWGGFAKKKGAMINRERHCVIETAHPSPLSVTKFRGCKCFSQANAYLLCKNKRPMDWKLQGTD